MKQKLAILLLLFANIFLLAIDVVPHHHHGCGTICFNTSHCKSDGSTSNPVDHEHDGHDHQHACVLQQLVASPESSVKVTCSCHDNQREHLTFDLPGAISYFDQEALFTYSLYKRQFTDLPFLYTFCLLGGESLRAPPVA